MKKKQIKKLMAAIAVAGGMLAGSVNSYAQTTSTTPSGSVSSDGKSAPTTPPTTRDGGSTPGSVPSSPGTGTPAPLPTPIVVPPDARPVPMPRPDGGAGGTVTPLPRPSDPVRTGNITLTARPVTTLTAGTTPVSIPVNPQAANSGVAVFSGDIVRTAGPGEGVPTTLPATSTPVLTLVQQFDAQRTQELAARATVLEQLRTASPEQRSAIIAEMQATVQRQAVEQREAARELRNELRAMREERKGR